MSELMRKHQDLSAMVGLVREHVGEHGGARRPNSCPASPRKTGDSAVRLRRESIGEHAEALRGALFVGSGSLFHGAAIGFERRRTLEMRSGMLDPYEAAVMQMSENGGNGAAAAAVDSAQLGAPSPRIEMLQQELIHGVVDGVGFQDDIANLE